MLKKIKLALGAATALLTVAGLVVAPQVNADEISDLKERISKLEKHEADKATHFGSNMVFFRAGYARNNEDRYGEILTDTTGIAGQRNGGKDGWYVGAGFDLVLSEDLFGFHDSTEILGEVMFEYKEFDKKNLAVSTLPTALNTVVTNTHPAASPGSVKVGQFTLTASPKIKFLKGSKFRPWIIPVGFAIHVISPPSDGVTVLEPGMHFAAGADFNVWNNVFIGADVRYNLIFGNLDGTNLEGLTAGAYAGFGF